jgi:hypothetical protein
VFRGRGARRCSVAEGDSVDQRAARNIVELIGRLFARGEDDGVRDAAPK